MKRILTYLLLLLIALLSIVVSRKILPMISWAKNEANIEANEMEPIGKQENVIEIKESETNVDTSLSNSSWSNKNQNEVTFKISFHANGNKDNLIKEPEVKIELPNEVEKVIIQDSNIFHNNGLEIKDIGTQINDNGNLEIIAKLEGEQTDYNESELELSTDVRITATIILKKEIESKKERLKIQYRNQSIIDDRIEVKNQEIPLEIEHYENEIEQQKFYKTKAISQSLDGLKLEVVAVRGDVELKDQDKVYEGEYIKYNIKVTNTTQSSIENVKVIGKIPEGTTYAELEADYTKAGSKYSYNFDESMKEKQIEIGTIEARRKYQYLL